MNGPQAEENEPLRQENARLLNELTTAYEALEQHLGDVDRERGITYAELQERTRRLQGANVQLQTSLREKDILLKEVHHRVKNNIQVISNLLSLQARGTGDERVAEVLNESQNRLRSMALIHELLYTSGDLARLDIPAYVRQLAADLLQTYGTSGPRVGLEFALEPVLLDVNTAISCGLILNELISNAFRHAFPPGKQGDPRVCVRLREVEDGGFALAVVDNGRGLPAGVAVRSPRTLGLQLVNGLVAQLGGQLRCRGDAGTEIEVVFDRVRRVASLTSWDLRPGERVTAPVAVVVVADPVVRGQVGECVQHYGYACCMVESGEEALALYAQVAPELVLLDRQLPGMDPLQVLRQMRQLDPGGKVLLLDVGADAAVSAEVVGWGTCEGAGQPPAPTSLAVRLEEMRQDTNRTSEENRLEGVIGQSDVMREVFRVVHRVARTNATVLIRGESGTGKELIAQAIHNLAHGPNEPFVTVDCTHIPANLMESELFGHERGAFTDAKVRKRGLLPLDLQTKLLSILETQRFRRVGGTEEIKVAVRFLAATNENLEDAVREGRFRQDLFYRLNVVPVDLPPLRDRGRDVLLLAYYYLSQHTVSHGMPGRRFSEEARDLLLVYPWPGNVRELKNATERAVLMTEGDLVRPEDLTIDRRSRRKAVPPAGGVRTDVQGEVSVAFPPEGVSLEKVERELIKAALAHTGGNVTQAAALLHLSRDTLRYRMAKHEEGASREPGEN